VEFVLCGKRSRLGAQSHWATRGVVLDGQSRLEAAKSLGLASVPCIRVNHLDETEQRLLRLAVNRLAEKGSWDVGELKAEFEELISAPVQCVVSPGGSSSQRQTQVFDLPV
jgi:ParB-like chromosome segregation protein Spo0J